MILPPIDPEIPSAEGKDLEGADPRCPSCLGTMEPRISAQGRERWECLSCGASRLS